jgi:hypothetical protein
MASKNRKFLDSFDNFWAFVSKAEHDIRQNGHLGRMPPDSHDDPVDDAFAAAYETIRPHLKKFRRERYFTIPVGLALASRPFSAETAHQALMFFLDPPKDLYGEKGVLDSPEYLAIKESAMQELQKRDEARISVAAEKTPSLSAKMASELIELRAFVFDHHLPKGGRVQTTTLKSTEIEERFGWSQSTVSRKMGKLFKSNHGMSVYGAVFGTHTPDDVVHNRLEDSTLSVDAIWIDRRPENDEDCDQKTVDDRKTDDEDEQGRQQLCEVESKLNIQSPE